MPLFIPGKLENQWIPTAMAIGPFGGLLGGGVAGLLTAEVEALAAQRDLGVAVGAAIWFLKPMSLVPLHTRISVVRSGGRISVVDNTMWLDGEDEPCATARVTLTRHREMQVPGYQPPVRTSPLAIADLPARKMPALRTPSYADAIEARLDGGTAWFRLKEQIIAGAGPLAQVLVPADFAHGIGRPVQNVVADPNLTVAVNLLAPPRGEWIGVEPSVLWQPAAGLGIGNGRLHDAYGVIGHVTMDVVLQPFPKPRSEQAGA